MITRIAIDGFKSFVGFELELEPFTVLAGANNSGKSNLLEAVTLLRDLYPLGDDAPLVKRGRGTGVELFHRADDGVCVTEFSILAVGDDDEVYDAEVVVQAGRPGLAVRIGDPTEFIDLDGALDALDAWILVNPHPPAMRNGASLNDVLPLAPDCANLATVIGRISEAGGLTDFVIDAAYVIGDLKSVEPIKDKRRNVWDFDLIMKGDRRFTPSLVSDGTLRVLALLAALHDPAYQSTVLVEELENGLHPRYIERLCEQICRRVSEKNGGRQVIGTTHSPALVADMLDRSPRSVVFLDQVSGPREIGGGRRPAHWTRARRFGTGGERGTFLSRLELRNYFPAHGEP